MLEDLELPFLTPSIGHSLAHHPSLACLKLSLCFNLDVSDLVSESTSISTLTIYPKGRVEAPLNLLQRNEHLLNTNLWDCSEDLERTSPLEREQLKHQHEARNRRLLHNWQCICVLLASYRANHASVIRDSMLSLMTDVMSFLVPDEWYVERRR
jgi:hypothetical protein